MRNENTPIIIQSLLSSSSNLCQMLQNGVHYARGEFTHRLFKLSEIKINPNTAERLAHMARK